MRKQSMTWAQPQKDGLLENILARLRARQANSLIPDNCRNGRLLDIGCGETPFFLQSIEFKYKYGINKWKFEEKRVAAESLDDHLKLFNWDLSKNEKLPFEDKFFDVVTMLAVFEHVEPAEISTLVSEVQRILKLDGIFVLTIPVWWTDLILKGLAKLNLVSMMGVEDHKSTYSRKKITNIMKLNGFETSKIQTGYFEIFMNIWIRIEK